jgi:predicted GIY-YIG superfamily endonuclease
VINLEEEEEEEEEEGDGVYVLELEGKRFYVGKSSCKRQRILEHKSKRGASFTKKHAVINDHSPRLSTRHSLTLAAERLETLQHMVRIIYALR